MAMRMINTELLALTVESQLEAGVEELEIRQLIYMFAVEAPEARRDDEIVGFLSVDDIPSGYRADFLTRLLALSAVPEQPAVAAPPPRNARAGKIWQAAVAAGSDKLHTAAVRARFVVRALLPRAAATGVGPYGGPGRKARPV